MMQMVYRLYHVEINSAQKYIRYKTTGNQFQIIEVFSPLLFSFFFRDKEVRKGEGDWSLARSLESNKMITDKTT